jgi:phage FluMu protein gp41
MADSVVTPQSAPRDLDALAALTPFVQRMLMQKLGAMATPEENKAWLEMTGNDEPKRRVRAQRVLQALQKFDAENGVVPNATAPAMVQTQQPVGAAPGSPPAVSSEGLAAAAAGATGTKMQTARTPRTPAAPASAETKAPGDLGVEVINLLTRLLGDVGTITPQVNAQADKLFALVGNHEKQQGAVLDKQHAELIVALKDVSAALQSNTQISMWLLCMLQQSIATTNGVTPRDVLEMAIADAAAFQGQVRELTGAGKG